MVNWKKKKLVIFKLKKWHYFKKKGHKVKWRSKRQLILLDLRVYITCLLFDNINMYIMYLAKALTIGLEIRSICLPQLLFSILIPLSSLVLHQFGIMLGLGIHCCCISVLNLKYIGTKNWREILVIPCKQLNRLWIPAKHQRWLQSLCGL